MPELPCAVPRFTPRPCKNPAVFVVHRPRGVPLGPNPVQPNPTHVEEPSCATCTKPFRKEGSDAEIRDLVAEDYERRCQDTYCDTGALTVPGGTMCPDCHEDDAPEPIEGRFAELEGNPNIPEVDLTIRPEDVKAEPRKLKGTWSAGRICGTVVLVNGARVDLNGCTEECGLVSPPDWIERMVPTTPAEETSHLVAFCPKHRGRIPKFLRWHIPPPGPGMWHMHRTDDTTGVSGTGHVATWAVFDDAAVVRWRTPTRSTVTWDDVEDACHVHILAHPGQTYLVSDDGEYRWPPYPCVACKGVGRHEDPCARVERLKVEMEAVQPMTRPIGRIEFHTTPEQQKALDDLAKAGDELVAALMREVEAMVERTQAAADPIAKSLLAVLEPWLKEVKILPPTTDRVDLGGEAHCRECEHRWDFPADPTGRGPEACPACTSRRVSLTWAEADEQG